MKATFKRVRISPKKLNLIAKLIRNQKADEALVKLKNIPKKASLTLYKTLKSAIHNAEKNFDQKADKLYIKSIIITEGPTYKRFNPVSRGRAHRIRKRTSHLHINLEVK